MLVFVVLNILIITEMCHSFPSNHPYGQYNTREYKTKPANHSQRIGNSRSSSKSFERGNLTEIHKKDSNKPGNYTTGLINHTDNTQISPNTLLFNTPLLTDRHPYKSGSISDLLNRYGTSSVLLVNPPGSYQTQLEFEPAKTTTLPPTPSRESIKSASLKSEIYHPSRSSTTLRNSKRHKHNSETPPRLSPVRAASLNTEIYHRPPENNTDKSDRALMRPAGIVLYNQTIVHLNEPKYLHATFPLRKPRNLREFPIDDLIEHNTKESDSNETDSENEAEAETETEKDDGANDASDDDETTTESETTETEGAETASLDEQPPLDKHEMRYLHDIFLNYPKTHHANYGHVQLTPQIFEKRFESTKEGNRYKGEVLWMDNKGGYAQHYWNLALGKL